MDAIEPAGKLALIEAVDLCGGQTKFASRLTEISGKPVSQQWVWAVINRDNPVPPEWCVPVERATREIVETESRGRVISKEELRPDLYPRDEAAA